MNRPMSRREVYGKYQLLSRIGSGGMAEVWLARSSSIGGFEKLLAIKRMHSRFCSSESFISLFIEEAKLSVSLSHPNIVQVFDFGEVDGNYYIAMEYVDGVDLSQIAARARASGKPLPVGASTYIVRQALEGLSFAHGDRKSRPAKIIHRDVSPHNVLVSFDGQVKLSDFGIAKAAYELTTGNQGEAVGKLAYMSPEQARGEPLTPATDLWSAGVILHELLSNARLFAQRSEAETLDALSGQAILPPSSLNPDVPKELDAITLLLLQREPKFRPSTARVAVEALSDVLRQHYPKLDDYSLSEAIAEAWDGPPLPLSNPPSSHAEGLEGTAPAGADTRASIRGFRSKPPFPLEDTPAPVLLPVDSTAPRAAREAARPEVEAQVEALKRQFLADPNLWTLFDIGEVYQGAGLQRRALGAFQLAAAKFGQAGLLVQALAILCHVRELTGPNERWRASVRRLPDLQHRSDQDLLLETFDTEDQSADFSEYHQLFSLQPREAEIEIFAPAPIFGSLEGDQLLRLVEAINLVRFPASAPVLSEGGAGTSFFWIGRGRVVISAQSFQGKRVFLTSLADGGYFGEHAFFTGETRSATVEAIEPLMLLEVSKSALDAVVREMPSIADSLRAFYKDRIAEALLARSEIFGHLPVRARRELAQHFEFFSLPGGSLIIREGDSSDAFFAVRSGRVEVFTKDGTRLAELNAGGIFGEIAAVKGTPRTASVRALVDSELLRLEATHLKQFLARHDDVRKIIEEQIEARAEETIQKLGGG